MRRLMWGLIGGSIALVYLAATYFLGMFALGGFGAAFTVVCGNPWLLITIPLLKFLPPDSVLFPVYFGTDFFGIGIAGFVFIVTLQFLLGALFMYIISARK